jgi:hypothetical protein
VLPLTEVAAVDVLNRASLLCPPTARIKLADGRHFDLGVLASKFSPNFSGANAFDHLARGDDSRSRGR